LYVLREERHDPYGILFVGFRRWRDERTNILPIRYTLRQKLQRSIKDKTVILWFLEVDRQENEHSAYQVFFEESEKRRRHLVLPLGFERH
jgi:hypothetical protein